ncbi:MAG: hypothetical protein JRI52_00690 [Deltaproteobacteria bacterium]|nr:hypothetical protein [Deltaproteobacteria bacterium]
MPIRLIARDLYRLQQEVEKLEDQLKNTPYGEKREMEDQLRKLKAERDRMRRILEGSKEPQSYRKPR